MDERADDLIAAASRAMDPEEGRRAFARCLARLHEAPPWLYLYHPTQLHAHRPDLVGRFAWHRAAPGEHGGGLLHQPGARDNLRRGS